MSLGSKFTCVSRDIISACTRRLGSGRLNDEKWANWNSARLARFLIFWKPQLARSLSQFHIILVRHFVRSLRRKWRMEISGGSGQADDKILLFSTHTLSLSRSHIYFYFLYSRTSRFSHLCGRPWDSCRERSKNNRRHETERERERHTHKEILRLKIHKYLDIYVLRAWA